LSDNGSPLVDYWLVASSTAVGAIPGAQNRVQVFRKTDRLGQFEFPPLKGEFDVTVISHSFPWPTEEVLFSPSPMPAVLGQVHILDGSVERLNLPLQAMQSVRVRGRCFGPNGKPVHGNQVGISIQKDNRTVNLQVVTTDAEGRYVFEGVPRGIKDVWLFSSLGLVDGKSVMLKAIARVKGARPDGQIHWDQLDSDADDVDFGVESVQLPGAVNFEAVGADTGPLKEASSRRPETGSPTPPPASGWYVVGGFVALLTVASGLVIRGVARRARPPLGREVP
jgi:hypothetical protein